MERAEEGESTSGVDSDAMACFVTSLLVHLVILLAALVSPTDPFEIDQNRADDARAARPLSIQLVQPVAEPVPQPEVAPLAGEAETNHLGHARADGDAESGSGEELARSLVDSLPDGWRGEEVPRAIGPAERTARFEGSSKSRVLCPSCSDCAENPDHEACRGVGLEVQYRPVLLRTREPMVDQVIRENRLDLNVCLRRFVPPDARVDIPVVVAAGEGGFVTHRIDSGIPALDQCLRSVLDQASASGAPGVVATTLKIRFAGE